MEDLIAPLRLFEFHSYLIRIKAHKVLFLGATLESVQGEWLLETPFAIGQTEIEWWDERGCHRATISIDPDPNKIDEREQWEQMLADIADWNGALLGTTGVRLGSVLFGDGYNVLCVEAIHCLLRQFCDRIDSIDSWLQKVDIDGPINLQTMRPLEMSRYQSDIRVQQWILEESGEPLYFDLPNQGLRDAERELYRLQGWVLQVQDVLMQVIECLRSSSINSWRDSRAQVLSSFFTRLDEALRRPPLYRVSSQDLIQTPEIVSRSNPEVVQTHQLVQQILSPTFSLQSGQFPVSGRNSFGIYELWCFQQMIDCCTVVCKSEPIDQPEDPLKWGGTIRWRTGSELLQLHYNPRFVAYWDHKKNTSRPYSLVGEQRPDFVLQYRDRWLILDAKYRSTRINVLDAFSSAFSYVASLKIPGIQRDPVGCLLLVPKKMQESSPWFNRQFHRENGFGLLCCGPTSIDDVRKAIGDFVST